MNPHRFRRGAILSFRQNIQFFYNNAIGPWQRCRSIRPLHPQSTGAAKEGQLHDLGIHGLEARVPAPRRKYVKLQQEDTKDIVVDDLSATLKAHRATNKASLVRRFNVDLEYEPISFIRPTGFQHLQNRCERPASGTDVVKRRGHSVSLPRAKNVNQVRQNLHLRRRKQMQKARLKLGTSLTQHHGSRNLVLDYNGLDLKPRKQWELKALEKSKQLPWLALVADTEGDGRARLRNEIHAFEDYMSLKPHDTIAFRTLNAEIKSITETVVPSASIELMGSYSTGLATPTSDLDLRLSLSAYEREPLSRSPSASRPEALKAYRRALEKLQEVLTSSDSFRNANYVYAHFDLIRAVHIPTNLEIQIQGYPAQPASIPYTVTYLSEFPTLRPLYILLRSALQMRDLNTVSEGGVGSYPLLIMIVYALKQCSSDFPRHDIANQLLYTLELYSEANLYKHGFSLDPVPSIFDKSKPGIKGIDALPKLNPDRERYLLCLQDPADATNDLGRKSHGIKHVQTVFQFARQKIRIAMRHWEILSKSERESGLNAGSCLQPLVGADYTYFEARRRWLEQSVQRVVLAKYDQP